MPVRNRGMYEPCTRMSPTYICIYAWTPGLGMRAQIAGISSRQIFDLCTMAFLVACVLRIKTERRPYED